jgi:hypothetical protein
MDQAKLQQNIGALVIQLWSVADAADALKVKADAYDVLQVGKKEQTDA